MTGRDSASPVDGDISTDTTSEDTTSEDTTSEDTAINDGGDISDVPSEDSPFVVYNITRLFDDERFDASFMTRADIAYPHELWNDRDHTETYPQLDNVIGEARAMRQVNPDIGFIDIEHWPAVATKDGEQAVSETLDRLSRVVDMFRDENPDMRFGVYSIVPAEIYTNELTGTQQESFDRNNRAVASFVDEVDVLCPVFYSRFTDPDDWEAFARLNIAKAKELAPNKTIIPFVRPQFGRVVYGEPNGERAQEFLPAGYFKRQLEVLDEIADGAIIYINYDADPDEARNAPWWDETKTFVNELDQSGDSG